MERSQVTLKQLVISNNEIFESSILEDLKIGLSSSCLEELDLSNNNLGDLAPKYIGQALGAKSALKKLNMTNCKIGYRGGHSILLAMQRYQKLRELTLDKNVFDGSKLRILREMLGANKGLRTLNMNQCSLGQDGCLYLALGFIKNTTLKKLTLAENNFGDEGIEHLT